VRELALRFLALPAERSLRALSNDVGALFCVIDLPRLGELLVTTRGTRQVARGDGDYGNLQSFEEVTRWKLQAARFLKDTVGGR
jgi:hypothetical protein